MGATGLLSAGSSRRAGAVEGAGRGFSGTGSGRGGGEGKGRAKGTENTSWRQMPSRARRTRSRSSGSNSRSTGVQRLAGGAGAVPRAERRECPASPGCLRRGDGRGWRPPRHRPRGGRTGAANDGAFPDRASALRLITTVALEVSSIWSDRRYLDMSLLNPSQPQPVQQTACIRTTDDVLRGLERMTGTGHPLSGAEES